MKWSTPRQERNDYGESVWITWTTAGPTREATFTHSEDAMGFVSAMNIDD